MTTSIRHSGKPPSICRRLQLRLGLSLLLLALPGAAVSGVLEDELNARWRGAWVILLGETGSDCDGGYTDNRVTGGRVLGRGRQRLAAGELGQVARVDVKRSRVDVLIDLAEPLRVSWFEGPFELHQQVPCRVELEFEVERRLLRAKRSGAVEPLLSAVLERHPDRQTATGSPRWNRRSVEPLPPDHEETLAAHAAWKQQLFLAALAARLGEALEAAQRVTDRVETGDAYAAGLAAGVDHYASRHGLTTDCARLPDESFYPGSAKPPPDYDDRQADDWEEGYADGQTLAFNVALARRLDRCLRGF